MGKTREKKKMGCEEILLRIVCQKGSVVPAKKHNFNECLISTSQKITAEADQIEMVSGKGQSTW